MMLTQEKHAVSRWTTLFQRALEECDNVDDALTVTDHAFSLDLIPGGLADKRPDEDFDPKELARGIMVELEHTNDFAIAKEIAKDHLTEDPKYYQKLKEAKLSVTASFAYDIYNRRAQGILNRAIAAAKKLNASARKDLETVLRTSDKAELSRSLIAFVNRYRVQMTNLLSTTQLASLLEGAREVAKGIPTIPIFPGAVSPPATLEPAKAVALLDELRFLPTTEREQRIYELPSDQQLFVRQGLMAQGQGGMPPIDFVPVTMDGTPERLHFPIIDEAAKQLAEKNVMTREQFDALDAAARQKAFTIAQVESVETMSKIRKVMGETIRDGVDLQTFRERVMSEVDTGTFLSDNHLEVVFRTNVQTAFSDGQMAVLKMPFVQSGFPYASYEAIHDDRARHEHLDIETLGIDGTNIFRINDPVFETFRPPWDYNCRCSWIPMTVRMAASKGISEAKQWLDTGEEPQPPAFVAMPDFRPPAGFLRSLSGMPLSVQMSCESIPMPQFKTMSFAQVHAPHTMTIGGKEYRGGQFIPGDVLASMDAKEKEELLNKEHVRSDDEGNIIGHFTEGQRKAEVAKDYKTASQGFTSPGLDKKFSERISAYLQKHISKEHESHQERISSLLSSVQDGDISASDAIKKSSEWRDDFEQQIEDSTKHYQNAIETHYKKFNEGDVTDDDIKSFRGAIDEAKDAVVSVAYTMHQTIEGYLEGDEKRQASIKKANEKMSVLQDKLTKIGEQPKLLNEDPQTDDEWDVYNKEIEKQEKWETKRDAIQTKIDEVKIDLDALEEEDEIDYDGLENDVSVDEDSLNEAMEAFTTKMDEAKDELEARIEEHREEADAADEELRDDVRNNQFDDLASDVENNIEEGMSEEQQREVWESTVRDYNGMLDSYGDDNPYRIIIDDDGNLEVEHKDDLPEEFKPKKKAMDFGWITVGGHPEGNKKHVGGTPVKIGDGGVIEKGPSGLKGKPISKVDQNKKASASPKASKLQPVKPQQQGGKYTGEGGHKELMSLFDKSSWVKREEDGGPSNGLIDLSTAQKVGQIMERIAEGHRWPLSELLAGDAGFTAKIARTNFPDDDSWKATQNFASKVLDTYSPKEANDLLENRKLGFVEKRFVNGKPVAVMDDVISSMPAYEKFLRDKLGAVKLKELSA